MSNELITNRYDFVAIPISHPRHRRDLMNGPVKERFAAFTRADLLLSSAGIRNQNYVYSKISKVTLAISHRLEQFNCW